MGLKTLEKLGGVAGFIPIVSSVAGAIKYFYYRNARSKNSNKLAVTETAQKTDKVIRKLNVEAQKNKCYENLSNASLVEMIPGVNIFAAIYSAVVLSKLSDIRDINKDPLKQKDYLFKKYNVTSTKHDWMIEALIMVDNLNLQDVKGSSNKNTTRQEAYLDKVKHVLANMLIGFDSNPKSTNVNAQDLVKDNLNELIKGDEDRVISHREELNKLNDDLKSLAQEDLKHRRDILRNLGVDENSDDGILTPTAQDKQKDMEAKKAQINQDIELFEFHIGVLQGALDSLNA